MKYKNFMNEFDEGEYISKEKLIKLLEILDWNLSREKLINIVKDIPSINITSVEFNKIVIEKLINGELID